MYLRCMCGHETKEWCKWLPLAEWWYNTHYHTTIKMTPYEVVYNQQPPHHLPYLTGSSTNDVVDRSLQRREHMIQVVKLHLTRAQDRMKAQADKYRTDRIFNQGEWVWLKLQPYRQTSIQHRTNQKLAHKFYGPFQIIGVVGKVAYKLRLQVGARIHNVFHVSQLKLFHGQLPQAIQVPPWLQGTNTLSDILLKLPRLS